MLKDLPDEIFTNNNNNFMQAGPVSTLFLPAIEQSTDYSCGSRFRYENIRHYLSAEQLIKVSRSITKWNYPFSPNCIRFWQLSLDSMCAKLKKNGRQQEKHNFETSNSNVRICHRFIQKFYTKLSFTFYSSHKYLCTASRFLSFHSLVQMDAGSCNHYFFPGFDTSGYN